jgi:hypothetical protein
MRRPAWYALMFVGIMGSGLAGLIAVELVSRVGWLGVLMVGLAILMVAIFAELDADAPVASVALMRRRYDQAFEGTAESRLARFAERVERNRWFYIARTIGIALALLGLNMFVLHQL